MKSIVYWGKKFFAIGLIIFLTLVAAACGPTSSSVAPLAPLVLYGATHYSANVSNTSYLYKVNTTDGTTTLIGDIGFKVDGMAYNTATNKLYGITDGAGSQLIEINKATGAGSLIANITVSASSVAINNGWDGSSMISSIGANGSDYYAQSFIANMSAITTFGVVIQQISSVGEIRLAIAADNGGVPDYAAPLYQGTVITPTTTATWYYETGINVPVTIGQKYYVLLDGYNLPGATGQSAIGYSAVQPISGEGIIWSNSGGVGAWSTMSNYPLAIYVEGTPSFSHPAFNSTGQLFAWNNTDNTICTINLTTGVATPFPSSGVTAVNFGLAFNNSDVLYLVNGGGNIYTIDQTTGTGTSVGSIIGLPNNMAHRGDFIPITGEYWGLDTTDDFTPTRNLLVIDIGALTLKQTIPTLNSLHTLAFGY